MFAAVTVVAALYALRKAQGSRLWAAAGWLGMLLAVVATDSALGAERGVPTAIVGISVLAIAVVGLNRSHRPPVFLRRSSERKAAAVADATRGRAPLRWLMAGPLAMACAVLPVAVLGSVMAGAPADRVVLAIVASVTVWAGLGVWVFFTDRPGRAAAVMCALVLASGAAAFVRVAQ